MYILFSCFFFNLNHSSLSLILVDEPRFKWIQRLICQVQNSSKFVKLGFNPVILEGLKFEPKYYSELQTVLGTALNLTDQTLKSLEPRFVHQNWTQTTSSNTIRCAHITTICVIFNNVVLSSELFFFFYFLETIFLNQEKRHHASTTNFGNEEMVEYTIYLVDFIISLSYWNFSPTILGQKIILTTMVL